MQLLKAPITEYKSIDDIGKFDMIWNVSSILAPIFFLLLCIHIYFGDDSVISSTAGLTVALMNVVILYKFRKYKFVGVWSVLLGTLICQGAIHFVNDSHLVSDTMWCVLVGFFTFFLFGARWGTLVLLLNLTGLVLFLMNADTEDILNKGITLEQVNVKMVINVFYVGLTLAFVIYKMVQNNKKINARYEKEIQRNEILIKEIHHRVKNNLQIISSLLRLQAAETTNEKVIEHFNEAINRIRSMALIHEKMYHDDDLSSIDIPSYLEALANDIVNSTKSECKVEFKAESEINEIDIENIVPISLIFNEMITNSLKHGFAHQDKGAIHIDIKRNDDVVMFHYHDNGEWKTPSSEKTFGLELLDTLTEQLDGSFQRKIENGTHYYFEFNSKLFFTLD